MSIFYMCLQHAKIFGNIFATFLFYITCYHDLRRKGREGRDGWERKEGQGRVKGETQTILRKIAFRPICCVTIILFKFGEQIKNVTKPKKNT